MKTESLARTGGERGTATDAHAPRVITTYELLGVQRQIQIEHQGEY